jgi:hypothetical protein
MNALAKLDSAPPGFAGLNLEDFRKSLHALLKEIDGAAPADFEKLRRKEAVKLIRIF